MAWLFRAFIGTAGTSSALTHWIRCLIFEDLVGAFFIVLLAACALEGSFAASFDVMNFGAIGDGVHEDTKAFEEAWRAVCGDVGLMSILTIPKGRDFLVRPVKFEGPCKPNKVVLKVWGNIVAPKDLRAWRGCTSNSWLYFRGINGLTMLGSGHIDGNGEYWWNNHATFSSHIYDYCGASSKPTALHFSGCNGLQLKGLKHFNSPRNHISIDGCNYVNISGIHIFAPQDSPNTDGIDISSSSHVSILDSNIQTGDDCVAINSGNYDIKVIGVSCGPGHGISVGSLGAGGSYARVQKILVKHCYFNGAQNGVRIKTWPGGSGYARDIRFEDIIVRNVENPIIIDQLYCNGEFHCKDKPLAVEISHVTYRRVQGSSAKEKAIQLICSKNKACTDIKMRRINITSAVPGLKTSALCNNVLGSSISTWPFVPCLGTPRFIRI